MQCSHYDGSDDDRMRCPHEATLWLQSPDGEKVPGCWVCPQCASATMAEYREKLDETWTAIPIDQLGAEVPGRATMDRVIRPASEIRAACEVAAEKRRKLVGFSSWYDPARKVLTADENAEVQRTWDDMPGSTSWMDAFFAWMEIIAP